MNCVGRIAFNAGVGCFISGRTGGVFYSVFFLNWGVGPQRLLVAIRPHQKTMKNTHAQTLAKKYFLCLLDAGLTSKVRLQPNRHQALPRKLQLNKKTHLLQGSLFRAIRFHEGFAFNLADLFPKIVVLGWGGLLRGIWRNFVKFQLLLYICITKHNKCVSASTQGGV